MRAVTFYGIALVMFGADQLTKWFVMGHIPEEGRPLLGHWIMLHPTVNTGGAFSILSSRNELFIIVATLAAIGVATVFHRLPRVDLVLGAGLALTMGGALGNLLDRVVYGHVRDFIDLQVWPIFNVADSCICVGMAFLAWRMLRPLPEAPATTN